MPDEPDYDPDGCAECGRTDLPLYADDCCEWCTHEDADDDDE